MPENPVAKNHNVHEQADISVPEYADSDFTCIFLRVHLAGVKDADTSMSGL